MPTIIIISFILVLIKEKVRVAEIKIIKKGVFYSQIQIY